MHSCLATMSVLTAVLVGNAIAEDAFQSKEARKATLQFRNAVEDALGEYEHAVAAARKDYAKGLQASLDAALERKDLDEAVRIREALEALTQNAEVYRPDVPANRNWLNPVEVVKVGRGDHITVKPLSGRWQGGGSKKGVSVDWKGHKGTDWMALFAQVGNRRFPVRVDTITFIAPDNGTLSLWCYDTGPQNNTGVIEVEVTVRRK